MADEEIIDVVDENDSVVATSTVKECLRKGILHRAVTVFLRNSKELVYLQRRSKSDEWFPGYWSASCTGHVKSMENACVAAERELKEELGISCKPKELIKYLAPTIEFRGLRESEFMYVFVASSDERLVLDPSEVEEGRFLTVEDCKEFFKKERDSIVPDALLSFEMFVEMNKL